MKKLYFILLPVMLSVHLFAQNQPDTEKQEPPSLQLDSLFSAMEWRNIGPFRGGRSTTVCGVVQDPYIFYMGTTGGGVWKTMNGGASWSNISDGFFNTGSVGCVAVAPSDPNVVYVGMGESPVRGVMTTYGDGLYKSTDAGKTWKHLGFKDSRHISKIRIHPQNPDIVYVAVQGSSYTPYDQRGIYKTVDGGVTWEMQLFINELAAPIDLAMDMNNPRILYASFWDHQRFPWQIRSGGEHSGIWKTDDEGETWTELTKGLPDSLMGKIGVAVSLANSDRVYAIIESKQGGLYRSDDAGESWKLINDKRILRARSWYYMHIYADPVDADKVVVLNAPFMESTDGGKTFTQISTPHGDNHDLWIHPNHPEIMINSNDGGANISYNAGRTWSTQRNQPTAQFYRVNVDNQFPYRVYGGQQDNTSVSIASAWDDDGIPWEAFYPVGGCESAYCAFDPDDPRYVYAGCYQGIISEYDTRLKKRKDIMAYPELGLGQKPSNLKYRFNWNAPILMSQHDKAVIYHAGNKVLKSTDRGLSWEEISPDLTRNSNEKQDWGGGPITNEAAGGENYQTIMALAESPLNPKELWAGSDDGLVHLSRNGGSTWSNITPPDMQEGIVNTIECGQHSAGTAYVSFTRYKFNDMSPEIYMTKDFGDHWELIVNGIDAAPVRVVREDPVVEGLLYAGTEHGLYLSTDAGSNWEPFQLNLPVVPITDLILRHGDLIVSTQGRAFWILDDLSSIREWDLKNNLSKAQFSANKIAYLWGGERKDDLTDKGTNPDYGLLTRYYLPNKDSMEVSFKLRNDQGEIIKSFSSLSKLKDEKCSAKPGIHKLVWNLRPSQVKEISDVITLGGNDGPLFASGPYSITLYFESDSIQKDFEIKEDPRLDAKDGDLLEKKQLLTLLDSASIHLIQTVKEMHHVRNQLKTFSSRSSVTEDSMLVAQIENIQKEIDSLEIKLIQPQQATFQDVVNFPSKLNAALRHIQDLIENSYPPVTNGQKERVQDLLNQWQDHENEWKILLDQKVHGLNQMILQKELDFIDLELPKEP